MFGGGYGGGGDDGDDVDSGSWTNGFARVEQRVKGHTHAHPQHSFQPNAITTFDWNANTIKVCISYVFTVLRRHRHLIIGLRSKFLSISKTFVQKYAEQH